MAKPEGVFVHPNGLCESDDVGAGTRVWAFAQVMAGARVGRDCNLCGGSFVEAGAVIGDGVIVKNGVQVWDRVELADHVFVGPNATFTNDPRPRAHPDHKIAPEDLVPTRVREGASIGANATVICGIEIGAHAFVAAGSVVTGDVPAHALMMGAPARRVGWACVCGDRLSDALACHCGRRYALVDETVGLAPAK